MDAHRGAARLCLRSWVARPQTTTGRAPGVRLRARVHSVRRGSPTTLGSSRLKLRRNSMALERAEGCPNTPGLHAGQRLVSRHRRDRRGRLDVRPQRTEHARAASRRRLPYRACSEGALRASSLRPVANQSSRLVPGKCGGGAWTGGRGALTCAGGGGESDLGMTLAPLERSAARGKGYP